MVKPVRGDLDRPQFRGLADIMRRYTGGRANATQEQNLALRWVPDGYLHDVWEALDRIGLNESGRPPHHQRGVLPRHRQLQAGHHLLHGPGQGHPRRDGHLERDLMEDEGVKNIRIKMSGCPNGCGLHHIANIGFHGAALKGPDGSRFPPTSCSWAATTATTAWRTPASAPASPGSRCRPRPPPACSRPSSPTTRTTAPTNPRSSTSSSSAWGWKELTEVAIAAEESAQAADPGSDMYVDWERTNIYKLERGEGECAVYSLRIFSLPL